MFMYIAPWIVQWITLCTEFLPPVTKPQVKGRGQRSAITCQPSYGLGDGLGGVAQCAAILPVDSFFFVSSIRSLFCCDFERLVVSSVDVNLV